MARAAAMGDAGYDRVQGVFSRDVFVANLDGICTRLHAGGAVSPVRLVRWWAGHNQSLNLDPSRVGFLGLSAGAHLVAHLAWRHDERLYARLDAVDEESALPNFQILVYPWNLEPLAPSFRSSHWLGGPLRQPSNASRPLPTAPPPGSPPPGGPQPLPPTPALHPTAAFPLPWHWTRPVSGPEPLCWTRPSDG